MWNRSKNEETPPRPAAQPAAAPQDPIIKPQDPIIETLQRRRLNRLDHPVKLAQGPSPSCAGGRWPLYCSHASLP